MEHIIRGLTFAIIPIIVSGLLAFLRQPKKAKKGKVHLPKFFVILGITTSTIFLIPTIITLFADEELWVPVLFFIFSLFGTIFIIGFINCRISYDENGFTFRNFFGIKRKATYEQITAIKENMHETYLYIGKRKVMVDEFSIGGTEFIKFVKKKYRCLHRGQAIPQIYKTKFDIFNGNVEDVTGFLVVYILISVILIGFLIFIICNTFKPSTINNTLEQSVIFTSYDIQNDKVILTSTDNQLYKIYYAEKLSDTESIKTLCDGKTALITYSRMITPTDEDDYFSVEAIIHNDNYLLSFEESNRLSRQASYPIIALFSFLLLLWMAYMAASVIVGRNPEKFSRKVVNLFFKNGYIRH